ncbi:MAG: bpr, partial [Planctomycetaceae bacterium]|nr:bpr [Planctomycetaceae bacterium]
QLFLEGFIAVNQIPNLSSLSGQGLLGVVPIYKLLTSAGPTQDAAGNALEADRVTATSPPGYDGTGQRVGILSNSFNSGGAAKLVSETNGDLPTTVNVLQEGAVGDNNEGRAMAEVVHDVAPGAAISFATAEGGDINYAQNIANLANPTKGNANIIVDDALSVDEPMFQDGIIAQAVNNVVNYNGVSYFSAAGNEGSSSYENDSPTFSPDPAFGPGNFLNFSNGVGGTTTRNSIFLFSTADSLDLELQWNDPFYTTNGVKTDLDIFVVDDLTGQILVSSTSNNIATQTPSERVFLPAGLGSGFVDVLVRLDAGPAPGVLKWVDFGQKSFPQFETFTDDTKSSTIYGHAAAAGAMSVAAAPYYDSHNVESFSSIGPTTIYYTSTGAPLGTPDVRQTPDLTSIDGVNTSFFKDTIFSSASATDIESDTYPNFFGTSAAAPHAAAVAALIRQANPGFTPLQVYERMTSTASDIEAPGVDNQSGAGLIDAYRAIYGDTTTASLNFGDSFESGALSGNWEVNTFGSGEVLDGSSNGAVNGTKSMVLQSSLAGAGTVNLENFLDNGTFLVPTFYVAPNLTDGFGDFSVGSLSESILHLDLSGATDDVYLTFSAKQSFDPLTQVAQTSPGTSNNLQEPMSNIFLNQEGSDGVAISTDGGATWYRIVSLTGSAISSNFQYHSFNLTQFANDNGINLGSDVRIKFQQFDVMGQAFQNFDGTFSSFIFPTSTINQFGKETVISNAITVDNVQVFSGAAPVVTLTATPLIYNTGAPPLKIDANASVIDDQTPVFDGGQLTIAIVANGQSADRLQINNVGNLPNQISTVNNRILFGGLEVGTYFGGSTNAPLVVTLNSNATTAITQKLLQNITFQTTSSSLLQRKIQVTLSDGLGGTSTPATRLINVLPAANIAPVITLSPTALTVAPGATAVPIDGTAGLTDPDSLNFATGVLTVNVVTNASSYDRIEVRNQGNAPGQIGFSGSTIKYGGVIIGTLMGGATNRTITFTAAATPTAIQVLLRNITFRTTSTAAPIAARSVQFQITDGDGGTSPVASKVVNVAKKNQPPVLAGTTTIPTYHLVMNPVIIEPSATVTDSDSVNFGGGTLTVKITANGTSFDKLTVRSQGSNVGQIAVSGGTNILYGGILIGTESGGNGSVTPLTITLNANATAAAARALLRAITFQTSTSTVTSLKNRTISFQLTDGQGGVSNTMTKFVAVSKT